jgi:hypothetical protein
MISSIIQTPPTLLTLIQESTFNFEHILGFLSFSNQADQLMINLFLGHDKNHLLSNPDNENCLMKVFEKSHLIMTLTQEAYKIPKNTRPAEVEELLELLVEGCRILVYELSCLQKRVPLFFSKFLSQYLEMSCKGVLFNWESDIILKSFCFMFLKVLKTYIYYQGITFISFQFVVN